MSSVAKFLNAYKVEKGSVFTHTSLKGGSYYIPADVEEDFLKLYAEAIENGEDLSLTEKHRDVSPILIDLDFTHDKPERMYTDKHIVQFLNALKRQLVEYMEVNDDMLRFYVLEKPEPRKNKSGGFKDGIHIICPYITTKPNVQHIIRQNILNNNEMRLIFDNSFMNSYDDIYDVAVIDRNNWFMYGSKKPDEDYPWVVSKIYDGDLKEVDCEHNDKELVELLSIRNKFDCVKVKPDKVDEVKAYKESTQKPKVDEASTSKIVRLPSDMDTIEKLVMILDPKRADDYHMWINLGICLKSINIIYLIIWEEFSKLSNKFKEGECEKLWKTFTPQGKLTEGTLRFWAKQDNPSKYREIQEEGINKLIYTSRSETHYDIAQVIHFMYKDRYVCCYNGNSPTWYEFKNHRWYEEEDGASLKTKMSTEVFKKYCSASAYYNSKASTTESDTEQQICAEIGKKLNGIALKLKMAQFKSLVMKECIALFKISTENFTEKLDSLNHIIGFENGVYDLKEKRFRDGMPEDFVKSSVGYDFVERNMEIEKDIMQFVSSIVSGVVVRDYLLGMLAYNLSGNKYIEQCWFLTGHGRNGKGTLMTLVEQTLRKGKYYHEGDVAVLTNINKNANSATSAIMALKNKRIAVFSESEDKDETIKVKILKQIVGRDLIQGREMYAKQNTEFRPTFSLVFLMNDMPKLSKLEGNLLEKLNVIRFPYRFCDKPQGDNEKVIDRSLKNKFEDDVRYRQAFMHILLDYYEMFGFGECKTFIPPEEVQIETKAYFDENNEVGMWLNEKCIITNNNKDMITPTELFQLFKQDNPMSSLSRPSEFGKMMSFNNFKVSKYAGTPYYKGIKYNQYLIEDDDE